MYVAVPQNVVLLLWECGLYIIQFFLEDAVPPAATRWRLIPALGASHRHPDISLHI